MCSIKATCLYLELLKNVSTETSAFIIAINDLLLTSLGNSDIRFPTK
jgi:hypothetical protein